MLRPQLVSAPNGPMPPLYLAHWAMGGALGNDVRPRSAVVDVAAVSECDHRDDENVIVDGVDDAVIPDPNPETWAPLECFGPWRPWVLTEECDCPANAVAVLMADSPQRANCGRTQLDAVAHFQPRSAFT